jgi:hypothetical protein
MCAAVVQETCNGEAKAATDSPADLSIPMTSVKYSSPCAFELVNFPRAAPSFSPSNA